MRTKVIGKRPTLFRLIEDRAAFVILLLMFTLLVIEVFARKFFTTGIPATSDYVQHLVLFVTFVGAMITTREKKHLAISVGHSALTGKLKDVVSIAVGFLSVAILTVFTLTSIAFILVAFEPGQLVGIFPVQLLVVIIPLGFLVMLVRFIMNTDGGAPAKLIVSLGIIAGIVTCSKSLLDAASAFLYFFAPDKLEMIDSFDAMILRYSDFYFPMVNIFFWPVLIILILSAFLGAPIFLVLGGLAILFFAHSSGNLSSISDESYNILITENIPAIPLFTLAGFILSESKSGERFVRLFRAWLGWLPGGLAVVAVIACAFFTTFTGASGVTILALGGLLSFVLYKQKYKKDFSQGLITGAGSIGLLFPPSLPIIMYGVAAQVSIKDMFVGGVLPGVLMVVALIILGVIHAVRNKVEKTAFDVKAIWQPIKDSIWEILLPVVILVSFFSGFTTLIETGALAVAYTLIIEVFIYRDIKVKDLPRVFSKCVPIIGGILIILAVAKGMNYYIVDSGLTIALADWMTSTISSPYVFLILLNIVLLITGCFMDIFAAILVVAPLVIEMGNAYGINSVHLGIIFLANLQLGYLTPPVGMNLFLAAYTFEAPLSRIYKDVVPFFLVLLVAVLMITYIPFLSTALLK